MTESVLLDLSNWLCRNADDKANRSRRAQMSLALGKHCLAADGISDGGVSHVAMLMRGPVLLNFSSWFCRSADDRASIARCE